MTKPRRLTFFLAGAALFGLALALNNLYVPWLDWVSIGLGWTSFVLVGVALIPWGDEP